jgi:hypothetical protein
MFNSEHADEDHNPVFVTLEPLNAELEESRGSTGRASAVGAGHARRRPRIYLRDSGAIECRVGGEVRVVPSGEHRHVQLDTDERPLILVFAPGAIECRVEERGEGSAFGQTIGMFN